MDTKENKTSMVEDVEAGKLERVVDRGNAEVLLALDPALEKAGNYTGLKLARDGHVSFLPESLSPSFEMSISGSL